MVETPDKRMFFYHQEQAYQAATFADHVPFESWRTNHFPAVLQEVREAYRKKMFEEEQKAGEQWI